MEDLRGKVFTNTLASVLASIVTFALGKVAVQFTSLDDNLSTFIALIFLALSVGLAIALFIHLSQLKKLKAQYLAVQNESERILRENDVLKHDLLSLKEKGEKLDEYAQLGIIDCYKQLKDTGLEPLKCMKKVKRSLDFMGVGGSKWVADEEKVRAFEEMLQRVKVTKGHVRFLIIDPRCKGFRQLKELRTEREVPKDSYEKLHKLAQKFEGYLDVRLYDHLPTLRLQFVDGEYMAVSRYYFQYENHNSAARGWNIPHLIIHEEEVTHDNSKSEKYKGSLYGSFEQLYDYIWEHSRNLDELFI